MKHAPLILALLSVTGFFVGAVFAIINYQRQQHPAASLCAACAVLCLIGVCSNLMIAGRMP